MIIVLFIVFRLLLKIPLSCSLIPSLLLLFYSSFLINAGADLLDVVQHELNQLCIAFAILGAVSLVSGGAYVSIWTYTGEKQALRIKEKFVKSAFHQGTSA